MFSAKNWRHLFEKKRLWKILRRYYKRQDNGLKEIKISVNIIWSSDSWYVSSFVPSSNAHKKIDCESLALSCLIVEGILRNLDA